MNLLQMRTSDIDHFLLEEIDKYVTVIGDASKVSTITNAVYEGYPVALDI